MLTKLLQALNKHEDIKCAVVRGEEKDDTPWQEMCCLECAKKLSNAKRNQRVQQEQRMKLLQELKN